MLQVTTLPFRTAIVGALLGNVLYQTKKIGVFEEYVAETTTNKKAILTIGTAQVEAYIVILNQTSNEARSNKCTRNNDDSIQIQINTVWPAGKGGSKVAEEIANVVLGILFPTSNKQTELVLSDGLSLWKSDLLTNRNMNYDGTATRTWVTQLVIEGWIGQ